MKYKGVNKRDQVLLLASQKGAFTFDEITALGISRWYINHLVEQGDLIRLNRGLFSLPDFKYTENHAFVQIAQYAPKAIICLTSALRFHGMTTQAPPDVWIALSRSNRVPTIPNIGIEIVRMDEDGLTAGVCKYPLEGVEVRIFDAAKTVADCFKYRTRVTTSVAVEALRDCLKRRLATRSQIIEYAEINRVWSVMRPYIESIQ